MTKALRLLDRYFEEAVCAVLLVFLMLLLMIQVVLRYGFDMAWAWNEELTRFFFVWFVYLGASLGVQRQGHIRVLTFVLILPSPTLRRVAMLLSDGFWLIFMGLIVYYSFDFMETILRFPQGSAVLDIPLFYVYLIVPGGFFLMMFRLSQLYLRSWGLMGGETPPSEAEEDKFATPEGRRAP